MQRIYIAGPFRAPTAYQVEQNVRRAESFILPLSELGACAVCPHSMTRYFDGTMSGTFWLQSTMRLQDSCHAILLIPRWQESVGATSEAEHARDIGQEVFEVNPDGRLPSRLVRWLVDRDRELQGLHAAGFSSLLDALERFTERFSEDVAEAELLAALRRGI